VQGLVDYLIGKGGYGEDINKDGIIDAADLISLLSQ